MEGSYLPSGRTAGLPGRPTESTNLADILERVLDKGIVIAGDIQINLLDIELLTIKLRLLIASVDRAREMGINWWETDPSLQAMEGDDGDRKQLERENRELRERLERLEQRVGLQQGSEERRPRTRRPLREATLPLPRPRARTRRPLREATLPLPRPRVRSRPLRAATRPLRPPRARSPPPRPPATVSGPTASRAGATPRQSAACTAHRSSASRRTGSPCSSAAFPWPSSARTRSAPTSTTSTGSSGWAAT